MANTQNTGRKLSIQRGNPASDSTRDRGNTNSGTRSQRRAYDHQQNRVFEENWADAKDFEERIPKPRGQTT